MRTGSGRSTCCSARSATPDTVAAQALGRLGVDHAALLAAVRALPAHTIDADALAGIGIDLDAVRAQVEASFGPGALDAVDRVRAPTKGHLPFDAAAKKLLEVALREAIRCKHRRIDSGHLLLAVVRLDDTAAYRALAAVGVGPAARARGRHRRVGRRAGGLTVTAWTLSTGPADPRLGAPRVRSTHRRLRPRSGGHAVRAW